MGRGGNGMGWGGGRKREWEARMGEGREWGGGKNGRGERRGKVEGDRDPGRGEDEKGS